MLISMVPNIRSNEYLAKTVKAVEIERWYTARQVDVETRLEEIAKWDQLSASEKKLSPKPEPLAVGQKFKTTYITPAKSIFWSQGIKTNENGQVFGAGMLNIDLLFIDKLGFDLSKNPYALNETIRFLILRPVQ